MPPPGSGLRPFATLPRFAREGWVCCGGVSALDQDAAGAGWVAFAGGVTLSAVMRLRFRRRTWNL